MKNLVFIILICIIPCLFLGCPDSSSVEVDIPTNLSLTEVTSNSMVFTWDLVYGATSYWIYLNTSSDFSSATKLGYSSDTGVEITGLNSSTTYYCWVKAQTITGISSESESSSAKTLIGSPTTFTSTLNGSNIELNWSSVTSATSYDIYHSIDSSNQTLLTSVSTTSYTYSSPTDGTHYFWLYAKNSNSTSTNYAISYLRKGFSSSDYKKIWTIMTSDTEVNLSELSGNNVSIVKVNTDSINESKKNNGGCIEENNYEVVTNKYGYPILSLRQDTKRGIVSPYLISENEISSTKKSSVIRQEVPKRITEFNNTIHEIDGNYSISSRNINATSRTTYSVGDARQFWIEDYSGDFYQGDTHLRATGTYCNVWVMDSNFDESSNSLRDNKITTTNAKALATKFDEIYLAETNLFGGSYKTVYPNGYDGLIEPSEKISILVSDLYEDYSVAQQSGVVGYFWSKDFYFDNSTSTSSEGVRSNEDEMFYIDSLFLDAYSQVTESTLAHEFQHMLNFVNKNLTYRKTLSTWYTEMLSMLCEDVLQDTIGCSDEDSPKSRLYSFNYGYSLSGIQQWLSDDDVYYSYAMAYAFGSFLARNYGGPELINKIATNEKVDMDSVIDAIKTIKVITVTAAGLVIEFAHACCYPDAPKDYSDVVHLNKEVSATINRIDYTFKAIRLADYPVSVSGQMYFGPYSREINYSYSLPPLCFGISNLGCQTGDYSFTFTKGSNPVSALKEYYCVE